VTRRVPESVFGIASQGTDAQRQHAARLLLSGYDVESAAALSGTPLVQVRAIAATVDLDELSRPP
jgi:hypothetical protein